MNEMRPESQAAPEVDALGLSHDDRMDLQLAYNSGLMEPQVGTVEDEAFRRMDREVHQDYAQRCASDRADATYRTWAEAHPGEATARQAEAEAAWDEPDPWAAEYDVEPEAGP